MPKFIKPAAAAAIALVASSWPSAVDGQQKRFPTYSEPQRHLQANIPGIKGPLTLNVADLRGKQVAPGKAEGIAMRHLANHLGQRQNDVDFLEAAGRFDPDGIHIAFMSGADVNAKYGLNAELETFEAHHFLMHQAVSMQEPESDFHVARVKKAVDALVDVGVDFNRPCEGGCNEWTRTLLASGRCGAE